jgi:hypothetical protein
MRFSLDGIILASPHTHLDSSRHFYALDEQSDRSGPTAANQHSVRVKGEVYQRHQVYHKYIQCRCFSLSQRGRFGLYA